MDFGKNLFHDYKNDINNAISEYKNQMNTKYLNIQNNAKDIFEELNNNGIKVINLIFNTAISDFENLKKNSEKYKKIYKDIQKFLELNYN